MIQTEIQSGTVVIIGVLLTLGVAFFYYLIQEYIKRKVSSKEDKHIVELKAEAYQYIGMQYKRNSSAFLVFNAINKIRSKFVHCKQLKADVGATSAALRYNENTIHKVVDDVHTLLIFLGADTVNKLNINTFDTIRDIIDTWKNDTRCFKIMTGDYDYCGVNMTKDNEGRKYLCVIFIKDSFDKI